MIRVSHVGFGPGMAGGIRGKGMTQARVQRPRTNTVPGSSVLIVQVRRREEIRAKAV